MRLKRAQIGEIRLASGQIVRQLHRLRNFAKLCVCRLLLMRISPMQFIPMQLQIQQYSSCAVIRGIFGISLPIAPLRHAEQFPQGALF